MGINGELPDECPCRRLAVAACAFDPRSSDASASAFDGSGIHQQSDVQIGKQQLYLARIVVDSAGNIVTYAPINLWNQNVTVNNLLPAWTTEVSPPPCDCPPPPPPNME